MPVHAFIFPGQGSQSVGMGRDLAAAFAGAREVFQEVDDTLKHKLSKLMFEGPAEELTLTENTQPALMAMSLRRAAGAWRQDGGFTLKDSAPRWWSPGIPWANTAALAAAGSPWHRRRVRPRCCGCAAQAMQRAVPDRRPARWQPCSAPTWSRPRARSVHGGGAGRGGGGGERQWRRPGGDLRPPHGGRAGGGVGQDRTASSGRCCCRYPPRSIAA